MEERKRDKSINRDAVKALVVAFGQREAARLAGIKYGTLAVWCKRFHWKKAERPVNDVQAICKQDAGDALKTTLEGYKGTSTLHLSKYAAEAATQAAKAKDKLSVARKVRDVAAVHSTLWPAERSGDLIEGAILIGMADVTDDAPEEKAVKGRVLTEKHS